jgi:serine protease Do
MSARVWLAAFASCLFGALAAGAAAAQSAPGGAADQVYAAARGQLLQIRTLVAAAGRQSSIGSGFLVSGDGLALTNYHVVSQFALEPKTYRLEYEAADGGKGQLALVAIDVADDLALLRLDHGAAGYFHIDEAVPESELAKGERLFSMGNPLDLGFTIVEGTYNGLVERSYTPRIHFSGALNPGMSGGPAVTADGHVVGVNVARQLGGELVSFLVPARFAKALVGRAQESAGAPLAADLRPEIGRQLAAWAEGMVTALEAAGFKSAVQGPYVAPESNAPWFTCWARTNAEDAPKPRASVSSTNCYTEARLFIANDLSTGSVGLSHSYIKSIDLNAFQFASFLSEQARPSGMAGWSRRWQTPQSCTETLVTAAPESAHPPVHAIWCARAYRAFEGLYDASLTIVTQDKADEALVSRLSLRGVAFDKARALTQRFLEAVQWAPRP